MKSAFAAAHGYRPSPGEVRSWENSLPVLATDLVESGLGDVVMLLEFELPIGGGRIDAVLIGSHPTGAPSVHVVENKQWTAIRPFGNGSMVAVTGLGAGGHTHPAQQTWGYCATLLDFIPWLQNAHVRGLANMHNAVAADLAGIRPPELILDDVEVLRNVRMYGC